MISDLELQPALEDVDELEIAGDRVRLLCQGASGADPRLAREEARVAEIAERDMLVLGIAAEGTTSDRPRRRTVGAVDGTCSPRFRDGPADCWARRRVAERLIDRLAARGRSPEWAAIPPASPEVYVFSPQPSAST